jgi:hypothetical protein
MRYVEENFDDILQKAEEEIREDGWIPADNESWEADVTNQPCIVINKVSYPRPQGDFLLHLSRKAKEWFMVTEETPNKP